MPTFSTVSGRTNMDDPTVLPVTKSDADKTLLIVPMTSEFGFRAIVNGGSDLSSDGAMDCRVAADKDVFLRSEFLRMESFSTVEDAGFIFRSNGTRRFVHETLLNEKW